MWRVFILNARHFSDPFAHFNRFRRSDLSADIACYSELFLYVSPVLLSTHVSSQDQRRICGLQELAVPATLALPQTYFVLHAVL